jgi:hypothetical protein
VFKLLGIEPATTKRTASTGDIARVPPYEERLLVNTSFDPGTALLPIDRGPRPLGWRATPILADENTGGFGVRRLTDGRVAIGIHAGSTTGPVGVPPSGGKATQPAKAGTPTTTGPLEIPQGAKAILAQEVRSPFAGRFMMTLSALGQGISREFFESVLSKHFTCRLMYYQYTDAQKNPLARKELATQVVPWKWADPQVPALEKIVFVHTFENPNPGQNFSFGLGLGVAVVVEKTSAGTLQLAGGDVPPWAALCIQSLQLEFSGKPIKEDVTV